MLSVTWPQVLAWRMRRQFLAGSDADTAVAVARRLGGVQAQVASAAELAVALRGASPAAPALADGSLVKTWAMRGTLHLLPSAEVGAYLAVCARVRNWEKPSWQRTFGATPADLEAIAAAAADALAGGAVLTREELTAAIVERTGSEHLAEVLGSGWGTLLKPLAWWGVLCYGPPRGTRVTFTAPVGVSAPPVDEAGPLVVRAFLGAHGPGTPATFDQWLTRGNLRKREVADWFDGLEDVSVDGVPMKVRPGDAAEIASGPPAPAVRLLGPFDQYVLGAGTSAGYLVPAEHRAAVSRAAGWISAVVLHEGRVAGVWEAKDGDVAVTTFTDVPADPLGTEVDRVRALLT
ncbi:DNA glycosylase AlkZ-like family protein [Actinomadura rayongensis]|uniref:Winged helix DNA-binding domain-containing protein n=1 Tax=Actinomadura rayongensis TaxID=1429076 RepID=A0A6I4WAG4_9ACTN|nr:crosslink repair DNA glycosylase YcaQ family protein [Actinomadura rayongensis]MXQ66581.1 winged helix DNA-binding domain-containing protein [Actinomadura rayongensis]